MKEDKELLISVICRNENFETLVWYNGYDNNQKD